MSIRLNGATSGYTELDAQASPSNNTIRFPGSNGTADQALVTNGSGALSWADRGRMVLSTAQNASGTNIDFTGIPSWVKRISVLFDRVSRAGGNTLIQLGSGGTPKTSGYSGICVYSAQTNTVGSLSSTTGILVANTDSTGFGEGVVTIVNTSGNRWVASMALNWAGWGLVGGGSVILDGTLDTVRLTGASSTFDAGSVNLLLEG